MMGDALKIGSWILGYLMLSKAMTKLYISTEIIFTLSLLVLSYVCTQVFGFEGVFDCLPGKLRDVLDSHQFIYI